MSTSEVIREATASKIIEDWARANGVADARPVHLATARATVALRRGATLEEACGLGRGLVRSWLRHPANCSRRRIGPS